MEQVFFNVPLSKLEPVVKNWFREVLSEFQQASPEQDTWLNLDELCAYLPDKPTKATVYTWVRERRIPYHKHGKRLAFLKSDIDNWIKKGREKTRAEIQAEAPTYLKKTG